MFAVIFCCVFFLIGIFCLLANLARLPSLRANLIQTSKDKNKPSRIDAVAKKLAFLVPISKLREINVSRILRSAGLKISPREYIAGYTTRSAIWIILAVLLVLIWLPLAIIPTFIAIYVFINQRNYAYRLSASRRKDVEKELPRFVSYVASRVKTNHNMIKVISDYKANYDTTLTNELAFTIADMKTGNQEKAIMNLQKRINSPLMTELCRGLISAMRGDDVTLYFDIFTQKLMTLWNQRLKEEALKKEPKVSKMSYVLLACGFISVFAVLGATAMKAVSTIQGV